MGYDQLICLQQLNYLYNLHLHFNIIDWQFAIASFCHIHTTERSYYLQIIVLLAQSYDFWHLMTPIRKTTVTTPLLFQKNKHKVMADDALFILIRFNSSMHDISQQLHKWIQHQQI